MDTVFEGIYACIIRRVRLAVLFYSDFALRDIHWFSSIYHVSTVHQYPSNVWNLVQLTWVDKHV